MSCSSFDKKINKNDDLPDYLFTWEKYKSVLDRIFFFHGGVFKRYSVEYEDFWPFLNRYQAFKKKNSPNSSGSDTEEKNVDKFNVCSHFDKKYRINMVTYDEMHNFNDKRLNEFKKIILFYLDFREKQEVLKIKKIKANQETLPIFQYKEKIITSVQNNPVTVIAGDTGCGKSTQVPQYLLQTGFESIVCTQPRRIACISLCKRVSHETLNEYGSDIAYQIRFETTKTKNTKIIFLTEGLLLRKLSSDSKLSEYEVLVIDEVHERHMNTDFLLGLLKCLIRHNTDLKIVLMSATINLKLFSEYFNDAPIIQVPGRLFPIELQYHPLTKEDRLMANGKFDASPYLRILQLIDNKYPLTERGDVLIFLSGISEIMTIVEAIKDYSTQAKGWIALPLHSSLSIAEQDKVFDIAPEGIRKCVVSTNLAETSVTIDGIRFVVDSGKVKEMSYDARYKMQRLREFWISQASAEQRKGRAGRTGPGVCFRLYTEVDYNEMEKYNTPEIQKMPLDSLLLQMMALGLIDSRKFPFIEPPDPSAIESSIDHLKEQGALTDEGKLTPIGHMLAQLPVDVVVGKMLIMGTIFKLVDPVLSISANLSVQSVFTHKTQTDPEIMRRIKELESDHGDPFTLLNILDDWISSKVSGSSKKWCRKRGLEEQRLYEVTKLKKNFQDLLYEYGLVDDNNDDDYVPLTSADRKRKHADKRQLQKLRKEQKFKSVKRKFLSVDEEYTLEHHDDNEDNKIDDLADIKDLEFRLSHNLDALQKRSDESRNFTSRDILMLKVILCCGLYPNIAVPDESNCFRNDTEHYFHTKNKMGVLLHPTCSFINQMDVLKLNDLDIVSGDETDTRKAFSSKHQILTYVSLLETTKPYLVNNMRVPALQTLLLYSSSIDTNGDCTRLIFDEWIEITFKNSEDAVHSLCSAVHLRTAWLNLIQKKLEAKQKKISDDIYLPSKINRLQKTLMKKLTEFLSSDIIYMIRRLLSADRSYLYKGPDEIESITPDVLDKLNKDTSPDPVKGGRIVNSYLTFDCLQQDSDNYCVYLQKHWQCPVCLENLIVSVVDRIRHEQICGTQIEEGTTLGSHPELKSNATEDSFKKEYICSICNKKLSSTLTEILKHRKICK